MTSTDNTKRHSFSSPAARVMRVCLQAITLCLKYLGATVSENSFLRYLRYGTSALSTCDLVVLFTTSAINGYELLAANPLLTVLTIATVILLLTYQLCLITQWVRSDYKLFIDLGPGGTPATPWGWVLVTLRNFWASVDVLDPLPRDGVNEPYGGVLSDIPRRVGSRPIIKGVAPQRQLDQKISDYTTPSDTLVKLMAMFHDKASKNDNLKIELSYLEGYTNALKAVFSERKHGVPGTDGEWDYEICHPHPFDGSLHMVMHSDDITSIIEKGWGERHPLATKSWYWTFWHHTIKRKRCPVPDHLVLIYAPRDESDFDVIDRFLEAGIWFVLGSALPDDKDPFSSNHRESCSITRRSEPQLTKV